MTSGRWWVHTFTSKTIIQFTLKKVFILRQKNRFCSFIKKYVYNEFLFKTKTKSKCFMPSNLSEITTSVTKYALSSR